MFTCFILFFLFSEPKGLLSTVKRVCVLNFGDYDCSFADCKRNMIE